MHHTQKANLTLLRQINHNMVLRMIQQGSPISRTDIVQASGLSASAVSGITAELLERGLIQEIGEAEGTGRAGRRAVMLRLNPAAGYVLGVKLALRTITCVITDLDANVLRASETPVPFVEAEIHEAPVFPAAEMIQLTIQALEALLTTSGVERTRLIGIGVGVNGIVDNELGICRLAPHFGWRNVPLSAPLSAHFALPVLLENDTRTAAIAEQWFGAGRGINHFVTVVVGYGLGAGVVANGQIYRGALNGAGEFGHTQVQEDGPRCSCGKRGCVEALAAEPAILRHIEDALRAGAPSALAGVHPLTLETITSAADAGDVLAQRALASAGRWLGRGLAGLVNILNPQLIIIKGEAVPCGHWYLQPMEQALREHAFDGLASSLKLVTEPGGTEVWARGAACMVLSALFSSPVNEPQSELLRTLRATAFS
jgi:predicted NBD/HSP70 family sugar kinase